MGLEILIGAGVLVVILGLLRPVTVGAAKIRIVGYLRLWERRSVGTKEGYIAAKDARIEELRKDSWSMVDSLAEVRAQLTKLLGEHTELQTREDRLNGTKEEILADTEHLEKGSPEYREKLKQYTTVTNALSGIDARQATLSAEIETLKADIEKMTPYLDEAENEIEKKKMQRDLGALRHEVASFEEKRAQRFGTLAATRRSATAELEEVADEELHKKEERGKILSERASTGNADAVSKLYQRRVGEKTATASLEAELARRRGVEKPATATPVVEKLSK